jgi:hypothetical protein
VEPRVRRVADEHDAHGQAGARRAQQTTGSTPNMTTQLHGGPTMATGSRRRGANKKCQLRGDRLYATHHAWNSGVELNMRATPTMQNLRRTSTRRHQYSSGRNKLGKRREGGAKRNGRGGCPVEHTLRDYAAPEGRTHANPKRADNAAFLRTASMHRRRTCTAPGTACGCGSRGWWPPCRPAPPPSAPGPQ